MHVVWQRSMFLSLSTEFNVNSSILIIINSNSRCSQYYNWVRETKLWTDFKTKDLLGHKSFWLKRGLKSQILLTTRIFHYLYLWIQRIRCNLSVFKFSYHWIGGVTVLQQNSLTLPNSMKLVMWHVQGLRQFQGVWKFLWTLTPPDACLCMASQRPCNYHNF